MDFSEVELLPPLRKEGNLSLLGRLIFLVKHCPRFQKSRLPELRNLEDFLSGCIVSSVLILVNNEDCHLRTHNLIDFELRRRESEWLAPDLFVLEIKLSEYELLLI